MRKRTSRGTTVTCGVTSLSPSLPIEGPFPESTPEPRATGQVNCSEGTQGRLPSENPTRVYTGDKASDTARHQRPELPKASAPSPGPRGCPSRSRIAAVRARLAVLIFAALLAHGLGLRSAHTRRDAKARPVPGSLSTRRRQPVLAPTFLSTPRPAWHLARGYRNPKRPAPSATRAARTPFPPCSLCPSARGAAEEMRPVAIVARRLLRKCDLWQWEGVLRPPTPDIPRRKPPSDCQYPTFLGAHPPGTASRRRPRCHNSHFLSTPPRHSPADAPRARPQFH